MAQLCVQAQANMHACELALKPFFPLKPLEREQASDLLCKKKEFELLLLKLAFSFAYAIVWLYFYQDTLKIPWNPRKEAPHASSHIFWGSSSDLHYRDTSYHQSDSSVLMQI